MPWMCGRRIKCLRNGFTMTQRFGKWPKYLGNGLDTWDTALVFEK